MSDELDYEVNAEDLVNIYHREPDTLTPEAVVAEFNDEDTASEFFSYAQNELSPSFLGVTLYESWDIGKNSDEVAFRYRGDEPYLEIDEVEELAREFREEAK